MIGSSRIAKLRWLNFGSTFGSFARYAKFVLWRALCLPADTDIESAIGNHRPRFAWSAAAPTTLVPFFAQYIGFATFPKVAQLEKWGPLLLRPVGHSAILVIAARASPLPTLRLAAALNIWVARGGARFAQKRKRRLGELPSAFSRFSESRFWAHVKPTAAK